MESYKRPQYFLAKYGISAQTLRSYAKQKKVEFITLPSGFRRYGVNSVAKFIGHKSTHQKVKVGYARVSSSKQKEDLKRQIQDIQEKYPDIQVFSDIASGINFKRKSLTKVLELVQQKKVSELVVMHKDRLCRFGYELISWILQQNDTKLVVLCKDTFQRSGEQELAEDLFAINTIFVASYNGRRAAKNRKRRRLLESQEAPDFSKLSTTQKI